MNIIKIVSGEYQGQGYIYQNPDPLAWDNDEIVYIPEHGFPETAYFVEGSTYWYELDKCDTYRRSDFERIAGEYAYDVFDMVDWQYPETLWEEMKDSGVLEND